MDVMVTLEPLPDRQVRIILLAVKDKTPVEKTVHEALLVQTLHKYLNVLEE
jgi:hypothetical protein